MMASPIFNIGLHAASNFIFTFANDCFCKYYRILAKLHTKQIHISVHLFLEGWPETQFGTGVILTLTIVTTMVIILIFCDPTQVHTSD